MVKKINKKNKKYKSKRNKYMSKLNRLKQQISQNITNEQILSTCNKSMKYKDIFPKQKRVIAIGDIHGDLQALMVLLDEVSKVVKFDCNIRDLKNISHVDDIPFKWTGKDTFVVIVGDIIDRKRTDAIMENGKLVGEIDNEEMIIIDLLNKISLTAFTHGGRLIKLLGNHEIMNLYGDFRYVSDNTMKETNFDRRTTYGPGGRISKKIIGCGTLGIVKIGSWIFVHGGLLPAIVKNVKNHGVKNFIKTANKLARKMFLNTVSNNEQKLVNIYYNKDEMICKNHINDINDKNEINLYTKSVPITLERRLSIHNFAGVKVSIPCVCIALKKAFKLLGYNENCSIVVAHSAQLERGLIVNKDPDYNPHGYVYPDIIKEDKTSYTYGGTPIKKEGIHLHGLNFECPNNNNSGQIIRIDNAVGRGFDSNTIAKNQPKKTLEAILRARRPSCFEILNGKETRILVAKKGLERKWALDMGINDYGPIIT